jgi:hypothetical protein
MTIWVIDTSSIINMKENGFSIQERKRIFTALSDLVKRGELIYPPQVITELGRYADGETAKQDEAYAWAAENRKLGSVIPPEEITREVMGHPIAKNVIDPDKSGVEEADPYVLALAKHTNKKSTDVVIVAQETRDKPPKVSIATACGALRLFRIPLLQFLQQVEIIKGS